MIRTKPKILATPNQIFKFIFLNSFMKKRQLQIEEKKLKHHSRRLSIKEGIFATIKDSFGGNYISPFAIAINASNSIVAMLSSIPGLLGPMSQIFGSRLMQKYPRKKLVTKTVFIDAFFWLLYFIVAILFLKNILITSLPLLFLILFSVHISFHSLGIPAWYSWIGDIVDEKYRGRWFAKRHLIVGIFTAILTISSSFLLDLLKQKNLVLEGFAIFFFIAFIGRLFCWRLFRRQYEPKFKPEKKAYFSFRQFLKKALKNNFGRFTFFRSALAFATSISEALLVVYLLRDLGFGYLTYMLVILFGSGISLLTIGLWGKLADKYGNYFVMKLTAFSIPIIPILWVLHQSPIYLIFIPSLIRGIMWTGFELVATNFVYDNVSQPKRAIAFSYYHMLNGIGIFLGAGLGAILIKVIHSSLLKPIVIIFLISAIARVFIVVLMLPKVHEVRTVKKTPHLRVLPHVILKYLRSCFYEEVHDVVYIKKYLKE